jgi:hypothetical protein
MGCDYGRDLGQAFWQLHGSIRLHGLWDESLQVALTELGIFDCHSGLCFSVFQDDISAKHAAFSASHSDIFQFLQNNIGPFETFPICSQNLCK